MGAELNAGVPFYGAAPKSEDVAKISAPLLIQSAEDDPRINAMWPDFEAALKANNKTYLRHVYPGTQHVCVCSDKGSRKLVVRIPRTGTERHKCQRYSDRTRLHQWL